MLAYLLMMLAAEDATLLDAYRARTSIDQRCVVDRTTTDITVCGRRSADHFRVPLTTQDLADPQHEAVMAERQRLLDRRSPIEELSPFLVGGGMAGVSTTVRGDGTASVTGQRPLAP